MGNLPEPPTFTARKSATNVFMRPSYRPIAKKRNLPFVVSCRTAQSPALCELVRSAAKGGYHKPTFVMLIEIYVSMLQIQCLSHFSVKIGQRAYIICPANLLACHSEFSRSTPPRCRQRGQAARLCQVLQRLSHRVRWQTSGRCARTELLDLGGYISSDSKQKMRSLRSKYYVSDKANLLDVIRSYAKGRFLQYMVALSAVTD